MPQIPPKPSDPETVEDKGRPAPPAPVIDDAKKERQPDDLSDALNKLT